MQERRVVITGMGIVSPVGLNVLSAWENVIAGKSGIGPIESFSPIDLRFDTRIAGEVRGFNLEDEPWLVDRKEAKRLDRFGQLTLAAGIEAGRQAGIAFGDDYARLRAGVIAAAGIGGLATIENEHSRMLERIASGRGVKVSPLGVPLLMGNAGASAISRFWGLWGSNFGVVSACASTADAIAIAVDKIRLGKADVVFAGGAEAVVTPLGVLMFESMGALSQKFNNEPTTASRPFDKSRDGFVMSEGGAILVLEEREYAHKRGAVILAEILGYGQTADAHHLTDPRPNGSNAAMAMSMALRDASIHPWDVCYLNAHGTSTLAGDKAEALAIKQAFGSYASVLPVSSTKSMTGHLLGATGVLELAFCVKAVQESIAPPTTNLEDVDPECDLFHIRKSPHALISKKKGLIAMSNSFGFGGSNTSIVVGSYA